MSLLKSLQDYLTQYNGMELRPINQVLTDSVDAVGGYALAPMGNSVTVSDILGNRTYINNYVFYARESAAHEADRSENYDFLEDFSDWLETQNDNGNLPRLNGRYTAQEIKAANSMLFDIDEDGTGLYQIQIQLKIRKESN